MVRHAIDRPEQYAAHIEVLSNLSLSFDRLAGFFLALSAVTLTVALLPTLMGYWPIMAIAIIHLGIVGWCFRLAWRGYWVRQDIFVGAETTAIEHCSKQCNKRLELPTHWLKVVLDRSGQEPRLFIAAHEKRVEIGAFLPADERIAAADLLRSALTPFSAWNRTLPNS